MQQNVSILGCGVATMDIYGNLHRMYPGGNEYNVACNAAKLGARAGFLGVFGDDLAGRLLEETLISQQVDVSHCHHEQGSSGYSLVELKPDGDRVFLMWNREGVTDLHPIQFTEEELDYARSFDVLSCGRLADISKDKLQLLSRQGIALCYDFHAAFTREEVAEIAPMVRYAFFSCSHLTEEEIREYLSLACECGCVLAVGTRGVEPVIAYDGKRFYRQETQRVIPTDTLGAGDSYIAGVLVNYLQLTAKGIAQEAAVQQALKNAAIHSAGVVCIEGSIGVGFDADAERLGEIVHLR